MRGIEQQFLALQKGFNELIPQHLLKPFDEKELEVRFKYFQYPFFFLFFQLYSSDYTIFPSIGFLSDVLY